MKVLLLFHTYIFLKTMPLVPLDYKICPSERMRVRPRSNGAKSWELAIAHTLHLSRTRGPEILYTLPRVARGSGMPLVTVAF